MMFSYPKSPANANHFGNVFIQMGTGHSFKKITVVHWSLIGVKFMQKVNLKEMFTVVCITCTH